MDDFRSDASGRRFHGRILHAPRPVYGLVRAFLERMGHQLRFHSPDSACSEHAAERALVDRSRASLVSEEAGKRAEMDEDRKSTRLNSSHPSISYAVFCLKKKKE